MNSTPWLIPFYGESEESLRLFCFPYAGGGASVFRMWPAGLPNETAVYAVQLPGRENRITEPLISDIKKLVPIVCDALIPFLDTPFVFFGHSLGSLLAFELCRELRRRRAAMPLLLIVAGGRPPHIPDPRPLHQLPEPEFLKALRRFSGTPEAFFQCKELMQVYLPVLRADFTLEEAYCHSIAPPLDLPIFAFGGTADTEVSVDALNAWSAYTRQSFHLKMIKGDHFFLNTNRTALLHGVSKILNPYIKTFHSRFP